MQHGFNTMAMRCVEFNYYKHIIRNGCDYVTRKIKAIGNVRYAKYGYLFSAPFTIAYILFSLYPMIYTLMMSFSDMRGYAKDTMKFVGFINYKWVLQAKQFWQSMGNTFFIWGISYIVQFTLGLVIPACLYNKYLRIRGQYFFKFLIYMPSILTATAMGILFSNLFTYPGGVVNQVLKQLGLLEYDVKWLGSQDFKRGLLIYITTWRHWGYGALIKLVAMMGINPSLFEAAEIDGANSVQSFFRITLPSIKNVLVFLLVNGVAGGLQMYEIPVMLGISPKTRTMMAFIMEQAFSGDYKYNVAAAAAFLMFLVILMINVLFIVLLRDSRR